MKRTPRLLQTVCAAAVLVGGISAAAQAQSAYPERPIRIVVPFVAGGVSDVIARALGQKITEQTGKAIVVENRAGAGGRLGYEVGAKAAPDGYTMMATDATYTMLPGIYSKLNWDQGDLTSVLLVAQMPFVITTRTGGPYTTLAQLIDGAKAQPGRILFGSSGNGAVNHLVTELFMRGAGISMQQVPYKGMGDAVLGLLSAQVDVLVTAIPTGLPHVKSGKMTALAVSSANRSTAAPQIPTAREQGVDFVTNNWVGLTLPKGSPPEAYAWMRKASVAALATPELRERLAAMGAELAILEGEPFDKMIRDETQRWITVLKAAGIRLD
jgi:tripartite-type tricarboxylate transporter receptor subunit TctC